MTDNVILLKAQINSLLRDNENYKFGIQSLRDRYDVLQKRFEIMKEKCRLLQEQIDELVDERDYPEDECDNQTIIGD